MLSQGGGHIINVASVGALKPLGHLAPYCASKAALVQLTRVMALALHPFVIGQPFRARYLDQALAYIVDHPGVWATTSDEIAAHYIRATEPRAQGVGIASR